jgi:D-amino-acid dehydrogenase
MAPKAGSITARRYWGTTMMASAKLAVIGAGIIGTTTALRLAEDGHAVQVFDVGGAVAEATSFANAGVIAPGYVTPWAAPGMPQKVLTQLMSRNAAVRFRPRAELNQWRWLTQWWRACKRERYTANRQALQQLAVASLTQLRDWRRRYALEYEQQYGFMQLLRTSHELALVQPALEMLQSLGVPHQLLDAVQAYKIEPDLCRSTPLEAAVALPQDEVGNCRLFAWQAKRVAEQLGAIFTFRREVLRIEPRSGAITLHFADGEPQSFDTVVVCAALGSASLLAPLGMCLPLLPVWGYSLSAPLLDRDIGPRAGVMDERYKTAITRLGQRLRVAGTAEIGARAGEHNAAAVNTLYDVLRDWFPGTAALTKAMVWMGARPMLPDGPPLVGATAVPRLYVNLGHGSSGWALSCGSADLLADILSGREPRLARDAYSMARYAA